MIASPWGASLFGTIDTNKLKLTEDEADKLIPYEDYFNELPGKDDRVDLVYLGTTGDARYHFVEVLVRPGIDRENRGIMVGLSLDSVLSHLLISILMLCAAFASVVLVFRIGVPILFSQVMLVGLALISPMVAMIMAVPTRGWAIAKKYFKIFLHFLLIKVIYGMYLSIVMAIATVVCLALLENAHVGFSLIFLIAMFVGATIFAGTFKDLFFRMLDSSGGASQKSKSTLKTPSSLGYKAGKTTIKWGSRVGKTIAKTPLKAGRWGYERIKKRKDESGRKDINKKVVKEESGRKDNKQDHKRANEVIWLNPEKTKINPRKTRKEKSGTKDQEGVNKE